MIGFSLFVFPIEKSKLLSTLKRTLRQQIKVEIFKNYEIDYRCLLTDGTYTHHHMILLYHLYTQEREEEKGEIVVIIISQRNIVKWEERGESTFCFF